MSILTAILCQLAGAALISSAASHGAIRTYIWGSEINRRDWQRATEDTSATSIIDAFLVGLAFLAVAIVVQSLW